MKKKIFFYFTLEICFYYFFRLRVISRIQQIGYNRCGYMILFCNKDKLLNVFLLNKIFKLKSLNFKWQIFF